MNRYSLSFVGTEERSYEMIKGNDPGTMIPPVPLKKCRRRLCVANDPIMARRAPD